MSTGDVPYNYHDLGSAIDPELCLHCFCFLNTAGYWYCCKCGKIWLANNAQDC